MRAGRDRRDHRPERRGQEHAARDGPRADRPGRGPGESCSRGRARRPTCGPSTRRLAAPGRLGRRRRRSWSRDRRRQRPARAPGVADADVRDALACGRARRRRSGARLGERGAGLSTGERRRVGGRPGARPADADPPRRRADGRPRRGDRGCRPRRRADRGRVDGAIVLLVAHRPGAIAVADREVAVTWASIDRRAGEPPLPRGAARWRVA